MPPLVRARVRESPTSHVRSVEASATSVFIAVDRSMYAHATASAASTVVSRVSMRRSMGESESAISPSRQVHTRSFAWSPFAVRTMYVRSPGVTECVEGL